MAVYASFRLTFFCLVPCASPPLCSSSFLSAGEGQSPRTQIPPTEKHIFNNKAIGRAAPTAPTRIPHASHIDPCARCKPRPINPSTLGHLRAARQLGRLPVRAGSMTSGFVHEHDGSRPAVNGAPPILSPASGSFFDSPQRRRKYPAGIVIAAGRPDLSMALTSPAFADTDSPGILRNLCSTSSDPSLFSHSYAQQLKREHFQRDAAQAYTSYAHTEPGTSTSTHFGSDMTWDTSSSQLPVATSILSSSGRIIAQRSASTPAVTPQTHDAYWDVAQDGDEQPHASTSYRPHRIWEDQRESSADAHAPTPSLRPGSLADFPRYSHWGGDAFTEGRGIQARRGMSPYLTKSYQDSRMMSPRIAHPRLFVDGSGSTASQEELDRQGIRHMDSLPPILTMDQLQNQLRMRQASNQSRRASVATAKMDDLPADDWDVPSRLASAAAAPMLEVSSRASSSHEYAMPTMLIRLLWRPLSRTCLIAYRQLHPREETFAPSSFGSPRGSLPSFDERQRRSDTFPAIKCDPRSVVQPPYISTGSTRKSRFRSSLQGSELRPVSGE